MKPKPLSVMRLIVPFIVVIDHVLLIAPARLSLVEADPTADPDIAPSVQSREQAPGTLFETEHMGALGRKSGWESAWSESGGGEFFERVEAMFAIWDMQVRKQDM